MVKDINKSNFKSEVMNSSIPVLIDFYAEWCGPCKMVAPIVLQISNEREDVLVCRVNVDEEPELARAFGVTNIPMLAVVKDGVLVNAGVGYMPKEKILELLS